VRVLCVLAAKADEVDAQIQRQSRSGVLV